MVLCFVIKRKEWIKWLVINLVGVTIVNQFLKNIVQRPRPVEFRLVEASGYSFPSGHSMVGAAF